MDGGDPGLSRISGERGGHVGETGGNSATGPRRILRLHDDAWSMWGRGQGRGLKSEYVAGFTAIVGK